MDRHELRCGDTVASVSAQGAELCSLRFAGHEVLWQAGPPWPRHAPILFPIVGRLVDDALVHQGRDYPMGQHGFARDSLFTWTQRGPAACRLRLVESDATLARYPFRFQLDVAYALDQDGLHMAVTVVNPGATMLPASLGLHPAFCWPLFDDVPRDDHTLVFDQAEPAPIRRLAAGLLTPERVPTPVQGRALTLKPALFDRDALILDRLHSQGLRYTVPDGRGLTIGWTGAVELGIWSKPADFICIEPWHGTASPVGSAGEFMRKPGLMRIVPGGIGRLAMSVGLQPERLHAPPANAT